MTGHEKLAKECAENIDFFTKQLETQRRYIDILEKASAIIKETDPSANLIDFDELEKLNNYTGYVTIAILELSVNLIYLVAAKSDWEKAFFIKNAYLTIHETLKKLKPFDMDSAVKRIAETKYPSLLSSINELQTGIDNYRDSTNYKKIKETRHNIAGHIEENLKKYYDTIVSLNADEAGQHISKFIEILNKVFSLTKDFTVEVSRNKLS